MEDIDPALTEVEDEHKALEERKQMIGQAIDSLPEFMEEIRTMMKTLPTQKDIDTMMSTKFVEYDKSIKGALSPILDNIDTRLKTIEQRPAQSGGGFINGLIQNIIEGKTQLPPALTNIFGGGTSLDRDIDVINSELMSRWKLKYRNDMNQWLNDALPSFSTPTMKIIEQAPRLVGPPT